jgi:hypothetical protein
MPALHRPRLSPALAARLAIAAGVLLAATVFDARSPSQAYHHAPYCALVTGYGTWECDYYSLQQCLARTSGLGGTCSLNPWLRPAEPPAGRRRVSPRR